MNNDFFLLERALRDAWIRPGLLNDSQKLLIRQCLPSFIDEETRLDPPLGEAELATLQKIQFSCDEIHKFEIPDKAEWLTKHGRDFPVVIRRYFHEVACQFQFGAPTLEASFVEPLVDHLMAAKSHVATLNYDALLYNALIRSKVFKGYDGMFDGFVGPFKDKNLRRLRPSDQSYYLHLHGSPLYYSDEKGEVFKRRQYLLNIYRGISNGHVVLSHSRYKPALIAASELLLSYWRHLAEAMAETKSIILFGYGGGDDHLNQRISQNYSQGSDQVIVIQHRNTDINDREDELVAEAFWNEKIPGCSIKIIRETNILTFRTWNVKI